MNNKHRAVWAAAVLILIFAGLGLLYFLNRSTSFIAPPGNSATSTPMEIAEPLHIIETSKFYDIDARYPSATPLKSSAGTQVDAQAVLAMKGFAENTITAFKEANGLVGMTEEEFAQIAFGRDAKFAMSIDYTLYAGPQTVSYVYTIYQDTMGAHPNTYYRTFTFDRATGEMVHLGDLFLPGSPYLERLSTRTRADLPSIMGRMAGIAPSEVAMDYIHSGTMPIADSFGNFAIENNTLLMIFPPYQVGPYAYGTVTVPIPLNDLEDILRTGYRP